MAQLALSIFIASYGTGGGNTVYRLPEGIERFTINEINNPATSATAQSDIFVMFDMLDALSIRYA